MEIIQSTCPRDGGYFNYNKAVALAQQSDKWTVSLNVHLVVISPHTVWGTTVATDLSLSVARHLALTLARSEGHYLLAKVGDGVEIREIGITTRPARGCLWQRIFPKYCLARQARTLYLEEVRLATKK